jgi:hypothetical protein
MGTSIADFEERCGRREKRAVAGRGGDYASTLVHLGSLDQQMRPIVRPRPDRLDLPAVAEKQHSSAIAQMTAEQNPALSVYSVNPDSGVAGSREHHRQWQRFHGMSAVAKDQLKQPPCIR